MLPQTKYAYSGDVSIAYQVIGDGPIDLVFAPGFISHLEHELEEPRWSRFIYELSSFVRLIKFDKRGTGLSDRGMGFPNMDERIDDIRAVMEAAGSERAVLMGISEGGAMCQLFAATYPNQVTGLILLGTYSTTRTAVPELVEDIMSADHIRQFWGTGKMLPHFAPTLADDPAFLAWWAKYERLGASPTAVIDLRKNNLEIDVSAIQPSIQAPTLILHRTGDVRIKVEAAREMAASISNAKLIELPGDDHFVWLDDTGRVINEIRDFVGAAETAGEVDRILATVLFTDLVDSTQTAAKLGDDKWRAIIETHYSLARNEISKFKGREIKTLGDGILATFDGPGRAVKCARAVVDSMKPLGIGVRAGLHTGEIEVTGDDDIRGIAVNTAARVSQKAERDQVVVSRTVKDLVAGSGLSFSDLGPQVLKGLDEPMRLFRVAG